MGELADKITPREKRILEVVLSLYKSIQQSQIDVGFGSPHEAIQSPTTNDRRSGPTQFRCWRVNFTYLPNTSRDGHIEKEALGIVFALKKYRQYVYGRLYTHLTDHKPLLSISVLKKGILVHSANHL